MRHLALLATLTVSLLFFMTARTDAQGFYALAVTSDETDASVDDDGVTTTVTVAFTTTAEVDGVQYGVCHDAEFLNLDSAGFTTAGDALDTSFQSVVLEPDDGYTVALLMNVIVGATIDAADTPLEISSGEYTTADVNGNTETIIEICAIPLIEPSVIVGGLVEVPSEVDLTLTILSEAAFLRGDADGNGEVLALIDALYLLSYAFTGGSVPPCLDAADCDDNDEVFPIIDALFLLQYGFTDGDVPPDPGPDDCGFDPTDDDGVDCLTVDYDCP